MEIVDGQRGTMDWPRRAVLRRLAAVTLGAGAVVRDAGAAAAADGTPTGAAAAAEFKRAAQRAELCSASNVAGAGLRGEYFANARAHGSPVLTRVDGPIDFASDLEWPQELKKIRPVLVRWTGWVKPVVTGRYRFHAESKGSVITVARQVLAGKEAPPEAGIELAAGRYYPIGMEWIVSAGSSERARLEWTAPYGARFLVPRTLLYLPTETAVKP